MWIGFQPGSSPVDWCEWNYAISKDIAEFFNTISNILFLTIPPITIFLFKDYQRHINSSIQLVWVFLFFVGASSAYFHAKLSLFGQLLDELGIFWLFIVSTIMFLPRNIMPNILKRSRRRLGYCLVPLAMLGTILLVTNPVINAILLMFIVAPIFDIMRRTLKIAQDPRILSLITRFTVFWSAAAVCWALDRFFCQRLLKMQFPYLHGIWHILIYMAAHTAIVFFAYITAVSERKTTNTQIKYWPRDDLDFGVVYVSVKCCDV